MNALTLALASFTALFLAYRFYGRWVTHRIYDAGDFPDSRLPSHSKRDGVDFVPTRRSVLLGHHYVTIAGAGPIVGPAVAVTWGWLPALLWIVLGSIFIGAVHDLGALVVSIRNRGRTIGDLAADIMTPRVRILFLSFIFMALWVVLAVFAFVIAGLFVNMPASVLAIWVEIPLALLVGHQVYRRGGSLLIWSLLALAVMYASIAIGALPSVSGLFEGVGIIPWLVILFIYSYLASVLPVTRLLQPRDYINSHQLFVALGFLLAGIGISFFRSAGQLELVAPAINHEIPAGTPALYPFLFITIACGAISGFHCMVASGTTARQLASERDARAIGYGAMILEGALAVVVVLCCVSAAGFANTAAWNAKYSVSWLGQAGFTAKLQGLIDGGAHFILQTFALFGLDSAGLAAFLKVVIAVVIVSFAATTMDSATRIQRYVTAELAGALRAPRLAEKHTATSIAVLSAAALAIFAGAGGSGGLVLWPIFGVTNQLLACLTFLILNTWLAKRGKPVIYTLLPMIFLIFTVSWAAIGQLIDFAADPAANWHLILVLTVGLILEAWMLFEGLVALGISRRKRSERKRDGLGLEPALGAVTASGAIIDPDGVIREGGSAATEIPEGQIC